jgi:quercetin dioxygenase-like cupin family protein
MSIVHEDHAPAIDVPEPYRRTLKVLLSPALHQDLSSLACGQSILPPGGKSDSHAHPEGELFYVLSGTGHIRFSGEKEAVLRPGTAVWAPSGTEHQLLNEGNMTLKILWVLQPAGREMAIIEQAGSSNSDTIEEA